MLRYRISAREADSNDDRDMSFGYDANGRMVKAARPNVPDALSVYDASGLRVAEKVNDIWRFSVYDIGGKCVAEYGGLQSTDEGGVKYVFSDWQGSTRAITGNTGQVQSRMDYTAFGEDIGSGTGLRTSAQGFGGNVTLRERYGLTERDESTGLDHTWWRKNENRAGRWTSPDPYNGSMSLGDPQSFNRYSYVLGQPTNYVDPSGLNVAIFRCETRCVSGWDDEGRYVRDCETTCRLVADWTWGGGGIFPGVTSTGGGGDPLKPDKITSGIPTRESTCKSLARAIKSHAKQAQRHINNYGEDFTKWVADEFPYNPLTGQLRDYQNHVRQVRQLTDEYSRDCNDQGPPPPVPAFADAPAELRNWKPFSQRVLESLPNPPTKKQMEKWYPAGWGPWIPVGRRMIPGRLF